MPDAARATRTVKSRLPISLVSRTLQPDAAGVSNAPSPASNHETTNTGSATTQKVSPMRRASAGELLDWSKVLQANTPREASLPQLLPPVVSERRVAPTETVFQSRPVSRAETSGGVEAQPARAASEVFDWPPLKQDSHQASKQDGLPSGVHFTPQHSRLAALLNANLAAPGDEASSMSSPQTKTLDAPHRAAEDSFDSFKRSEADAPENKKTNGASDNEADGSWRREDARLVEAVLEELYERFELEFLRAYGTSGE
jgi:hypothetical protein